MKACKIETGQSATSIDNELLEYKVLRDERGVPQRSKARRVPERQRHGR